MKKRSVTKLLSIVLAASMIATSAAPMTASAAEISVADETQDVNSAAVEEEELLDTEEAEAKGESEANELQTVSVPEVPTQAEGRAARVLSNGIYDKWELDPCY